MSQEELSIEEILALKQRLSRGGRRWDGAIKCTLVEIETGRIKWHVQPVFSQIVQQSTIGDGTFITYGEHDPLTVYFPEGLPEPRPKVWADVDFEVRANGSDTLMIEFPRGSLVLYEQPALDPLSRSGFRSTTFEPTGTDETFEFCTIVPGEYRLRLDPPWPHQPQQMRIMAI